MITLVMAFILAFGGLQVGLQARDAKAITAAKNTNVHQIEPSLPNKAFSVWLRSLVGPQAHIQWEVNDCGEQTGNPESDKGRDFPMCTEVQVELAGKRNLSISLSVGTARTGTQAGPAKFFYAVINGPGSSAKSIRKLSQVPEAIKATP